MDFKTLRIRMVDEQLVARGVKDERVLEAFRKVKRHRFVSEELRESAYADFPLPTEEGQTISQPYIVALMIECLCLTGEEKVLEIGTGSGYQAAILAELVKEVFTIERFPNLTKKSEDILGELGYNNIHIKTGDGTLGWPEEAPFDRIIVSAASEHIPLPLTEQLKENGKLIIPLGDTFSQVLTVAEKKNNKLESIQVCGCVFVPLVGKFSHKEAP